MRMVISGRDGQVARSLVERAKGHDVEIVPLSRPGFDLAGTAQSIISAIEGARPDVVVSAAAYTRVDDAEKERDRAFAINEAGARAVAQAAHQSGIPLIHLSTDYVFDGAKPEPYDEEDRTEPATAYGASKLAGEQAVLAEHQAAIVLRTAWVYSPFGTNFVRTMLRLAIDRDEVAVVADQRGNPTSALDIADAILAIAARPVSAGIFHMAGEGVATWADLATAVFEASSLRGGPTARVRRIATADYPTAAHRPANSQLNTDRLAKTFGVRLPHWRSSLPDVVSRLLSSAA